MSIAAGAQALARECPVHATLVPAADDAAIHAASDGHAHGAHDPSGHAHGAPPERPDTDPEHPTAFGFACCVAHAVGVAAPPHAPAAFRWAALSGFTDADAPAPGEISRIDPPPRPLL